MSNGMSKRPDIQFGAVSFPNKREGSDGDIQLKSTNLGAKLFGKSGGTWYGTPITSTEGTPITRIGTTLSNHLAISPEKLEFFQDSKSMVAITNAGDIELSGKIALTSFLTGVSDDAALAGKENVCIGINNSDEGVRNIAIGVRAGQRMAFFSTDYGANGNVLIGTDAGNDLLGLSTAAKSASSNVFIGTFAGMETVQGNKNIAIGYSAMEHATGPAEKNVILGFEAGNNASFDAENNLFIGTSAGDAITTGDTNICIGNTSDGAAAVSDQIAIGGQAVCTGQYGIAIGSNISAAANTFVFGKASNDAISTTFTTSGGCTFTFGSDERRKTDIKDAVIGLDFINELRTRTFKWRSPEEFPEEWHAWNDLKDENGELTGEKEYHEIDTETTMHGFIAQEGKEVLDKYGVTDSINVWTEDESGMQRFNESKLIIPLIKAVQELSTKADTMQEEINTLKAGV